MNKYQINCTLFTGLSDCINNDVCGWCGSSKSCVSGTKYGAMGPCLQSSYIHGYRGNTDRQIIEPTGPMRSVIIKR